MFNKIINSLVTGLKLKIVIVIESKSVYLAPVMRSMDLDLVSDLNELIRCLSLLSIQLNNLQQLNGVEM